MKSFPQSLQSHFESGTTTLAWCWRLTRNDGAVFGFTDHDQPLTFDGTTFEPESGFTASEIRSGSDLSVDAQEAEGVLTSTTITETDILDGRWDNATVEIWRVNWAETTSRALLRRGAIGQVRRGRLQFVPRCAHWRMCWAKPSGGRFRRVAMRLWGMRVAVSI